MYRFDFLPAGSRQGALLADKRRFSFLAACLAVVLVAAGAYAVFWGQLAGLKHREAAARAGLGVNRGEIAVLEQVKEKRAHKELARQELAAFAKDAVPWSPALFGINAAVPKDTRLVRIELAGAAAKGEDGRPAGHPELVVEGYAPQISRVGELASGLKGTERVLDVEIKEVKADAAKGAYYFKIIARMAGGDE